MDTVQINITTTPNVVTANIIEAVTNVTINVTVGGGGMQCADLAACQTVIDIEQEITDLQNSSIQSVTGANVDNTDPLNPIVKDLGLIQIVDLAGELFTDLATAHTYLTNYLNGILTNESFSNGIYYFDLNIGASMSANYGFLSNTSAYIVDKYGYINYYSQSFSNNTGNNIITAPPDDYGYGVNTIFFQDGAFSAATGINTINGNIIQNTTSEYFADYATGKFILNGNIGIDETANYANFFDSSTATIFVPKEKYTSNAGGINGNLQTAITAGCNVFFDGIDKENLRNKGVADGYVPLNSSAKIDQQYLPSYVDDVVEGYLLSNVFYEESTHITVIPASAGKIYIDLTTGQKNKEYRYSGSTYIQITNGLIASTDDVTEGSSNLYFTVSRVLATVLSGLNTALTGVITSSDTILDAFGKIQNSLNLKAPIASPTFTGTVTTPTIIVSGATAHSTPIFNASKEIASSIMVDLSATLTIVGWSSFTTKKITKIDCGSYNLWDIHLDGTSNSTTTTVALSDNTNAASTISYKAIVVVDNGGAVSATGVMTLTPGSNVVTFYRNLAQNPFTSSGRKLVIAQFTQMK